MPNTPVVTRFAPSPTGYLHVGGARTALLAWAFARRHGGRFILRMEDTDRARSTPQNTARILEDLCWLGLDWDAGPDPQDPYTTQRGEHGPYFQSQRLEHYRALVDQLLASGHAYWCFKTPEQLQAQRQAARQAGRPDKYDPTESMALSQAEVADLQARGVPGVVRFHMPQTDITFDDTVVGSVTITAEELEDFVILKADGFPTFHLAVVADDAAMGVTHVLRGQDHLMNTPKHVALQDALGLARPTYAHLPLIFNPDGSKMGKRDKAKAARQAAQDWAKQHGKANLPQLAAQAGLDPELLDRFMAKKTDDNTVAVALATSLGTDLPEIDVHDFRASGYLPGVVCNYLALLGWNPGNDVERFDLGFLQTHFSLERVGKSQAKFDREKLFRFNADTLAEMSPEDFARALHAHLAAYEPGLLRAVDGPGFAAFAEAYRPRSRTLGEPARIGAFFAAPDEQITYDPKAVKKVLTKNDGQGLAVLGELADVLGGLDDWNIEALGQALDGLAESRGLGMGAIAQPLRVAVTGTTVSPGIHETLAILGRERTLNRIARCLAHVPSVA